MRQISAETWLRRSRFLDSIRSFFKQWDFIEVETPLLHPTGTPEPFIENLIAKDTVDDSEQFLITSPEFHLKQVVSELKRPVFQIAHVFRGGDGRQLSPIHTREFLLLEWYWPDHNEYQLIDQISALIKHLALEFAPHLPTIHPELITMQDLLFKYAGCLTDRPAIEKKSIELGIVSTQQAGMDRYDELFFRLFLHCVEPNLDQYKQPLFVHAYPKELAVYSALADDGTTSRRFELYWRGIELANGYYELTDAGEQSDRFNADNIIRQQSGRPIREIDTGLMRALRSGMPQSSGVALGIDRLFMLLSAADRIEEISPFR